MKKLPAATLRFALPLVTTFFMTFLVSGVATWKAIGFERGMFATWMESWMFSWVVAFPTMMFVLPRVRSGLAKIIEHQ